MALALINANSLLTWPLRTRSVHMIACSPPYYALRDYGVDGQLGSERQADCLAWARGERPCGDCFVCVMRLVARECWRVLRDDGTWWLNLGDTAGAGGQLMVIPFRVALALQADGWILRTDVVWAKAKAMPEGLNGWRWEADDAGDYVLRQGSWRPTRSHEFIFLLAKAPKYYCDKHAVSTPSKYQDGEVNLRDVWTADNAGYTGAHFATWPPDLVKPMIKASTSEAGVCAACGAPWARVVDCTFIPQPDIKNRDRLSRGANGGLDASSGWGAFPRGATATKTLGWRPSCACPDLAAVPAVVLDPFAGAGTTILVARELGRHAIGLDLSFAYLRDEARPRLGLDALADWQAGRGMRVKDGVPKAAPPGQLSIFPVT